MKFSFKECAILIIKRTERETVFLLFYNSQTSKFSIDLT